jgi:hypothetical protein
LCFDLLGLTISVGMIAKLERITAGALERPVGELAERGKVAEAANVDETGWREARAASCYGSGIACGPSRRSRVSSRRTTRPSVPCGTP